MGFRAAQSTLPSNAGLGRAGGEPLRGRMECLSRVEVWHGQADTQVSGTQKRVTWVSHQSENYSLSDCWVQLGSPGLQGMVGALKGGVSVQTNLDDAEF